MEADPDKLLAMIRGIRMMKDPDPEDILAVLAEIRSQLPPEAFVPRKDTPQRDSRLDSVSEEDFAWDAVQEGMDSLVVEIQRIGQVRRKALLEKVLDIYYGLEEASREPGNEHLLPQLENMRAAYLRDYGHPIPPKEETEARRRGEWPDGPV